MFRHTHITHVYLDQPQTVVKERKQIGENTNCLETHCWFTPEILGYSNPKIEPKSCFNLENDAGNINHLTKERPGNTSKGKSYSSSL